MDSIISIRALGKVFDISGGCVKALEDISLEIERGEIFGIIGLSGAGKSTLVRCINYLEVPTSGDVVFEGRSLKAMSERERRETRRSMGMIFQQFNLLAQRSILQNVCFPLEISGVGRKEAQERAKELLELVGLSDKQNAYPAMLSGGQKQRVAIARAIATRPKVLLCDEATSALDPNTTRQILELLKDINRQLGITVIVITHEMKVIETICDRVAVIDHSHIAECGSVKEIFANPKSIIGRQLILGGNVPDRVWSRGGAGRKIRIIFDDLSSQEPVVAGMILHAQASVNILHAGFKNIDGQDYGQMLVELPLDRTGERACTDYLDDHGIKYEEVRDCDI